MYLSRSKVVTTISTLCLIFFLYQASTVSGYFESRYYCDITGNEVLIGLDETIGDTCLDVLGTLETNLETASTNVLLSQANIDIWHNPDFRWPIYLESLQLESRLQEVIVQIQDAILQFEYELFTKIKKVVSYHITIDRTHLATDVIHLTTQIHTSRQRNYAQTANALEDERRDLIGTIGLIDQMLDTSNFDQLIPLLQRYLVRP